MKFHIIQPVDEYQKTRSPARTLECKARALMCSRTTPPWLWTRALGRPVVPEEYRTHRGWSKGTGSQVSPTDSLATRFSQSVVSGPYGGGGGSASSRYGTITVWHSVGRRLWSS